MSERAPVVLLIDDEEFILAALCRVLRGEGYEIVTAENAAAGLAVLEGRRVDLVVSDQKMPGMSGIELLEIVALRHPEIPRILLTGWPEEIPEPRLRELGIGAMLPKPWDDKQLKETLRESLRGAGG